MNKCACGVFCYVEHPPFNGCYVEHPLSVCCYVEHPLSFCYVEHPLSVCYVEHPLSVFYVEHPLFNGCCCYVEHPLFARQAGTGLTLLRVAIVKSHVERLLNYFLFAVIFNYNYSYIIQYCYYK